MVEIMQRYRINECVNTCFFLCHVNYVKIKANNTTAKYLENNMTQHNLTTCPIFWGTQ